MLEEGKQEAGNRQDHGERHAGLKGRTYKTQREDLVWTAMQGQLFFEGRLKRKKVGEGKLGVGVWGVR